jgi:DNA-binding NtrC family response regulator
VGGLATTDTTYGPSVEEGLYAGRSASTKTTAGVETILLAEDDVALRALMRRVLQQAGYTVLESQDVMDAIAIAQSHREPIHLFLTDIVMPIMNGPNLAQLVLAHQPSMRVLYISGFPHTVVLGSAATSQRVSFLSKPFSPDTLVNAVRQALDRGPAQA